MHAVSKMVYSKITMAGKNPISQLLNWYLHRSNSASPLKYLGCYHGVTTQLLCAWVVRGNGGAPSKEQPCYFCAGTSAVTAVIGYCIAGHRNLAVRFDCNIFMYCCIMARKNK